MGWSSGSRLAQEIFDEIKKEIPAGRLGRVAEIIVDKFENHDADDWDMDKRGSLYRVARPDEARKYDREMDVAGTLEDLL